MSKILVTGCAGFIGMHLSKKLLSLGYEVIGVDNLNKYYDIKLKKNRLQILKSYKNKFKFYKIDLINKKKINNIFKNNKISDVFHLAAQAGVRYSILNPNTYIKNNLTCFLNILEVLKIYPVKKFIYASSSSVYGLNQGKFSEIQKVDFPISVYAASKRSNELIAHVYSSLFKIRTIGLRFFTVYGPYGRPDMALFKFTKKIFENKKIEVFNNGNMKRDFTYIDDAVNMVIKIFKSKTIKIKKSNSASRGVNFQIYNIVNNNPKKLMSFINTIEKNIKKKAKINFKKLQPGDVRCTQGSNDKIINSFGAISKKTSLENGISKFVKWYKTYHKKP